ncbi:MAG: HK97 family phage prohead protease [Beijerinckiaceae bacterium]|nr:HK97 family phage prohead protease [Beijerinckiaceae bacterium]
MLARKIVAADTLERREVKRAAPLGVTTGGVFEGYASLFGVVDLGGDEVMPGAFRNSLARRGAGAVRMLWQHDPMAPIGAWLSIAEDARGLRVKGRLNLEVARAREALALLREGAVDGLSIGFRVTKSRKSRADGVRRLIELDLWEVSLVTFPMLPQARVSSIKRDAALLAAQACARPADLYRRAAALLK